MHLIKTYCLPAFLLSSFFIVGCEVKVEKELIVEKKYENGAIESRLVMKNGMKHGPVKLFYQNGNLKQEGNWAYDKQEGTWTFYYETGEVSAKVDFHNDQQGHTVFFYRNGNIRQDGQIENGLAQGLVKHYYEDGQLKEESQWMKNKRHGTTIYFDSLTHKGDTILYDNGTLIKK